MEKISFTIPWESGELNFPQIPTGLVGAILDIIHQNIILEYQLWKKNKWDFEFLINLFDSEIPSKLELPPSLGVLNHRSLNLKQILLVVNINLSSSQDQILKEFSTALLKAICHYFSTTLKKVPNTIFEQINEPDRLLNSIKSENNGEFIRPNTGYEFPFFIP